MKFTRDDIRKAMLLYAVTDQMWLKEGETLGDVVESVLQNGATFLQIREKDLAPDAFEAEAERLKTLCARHEVPFVVIRAISDKADNSAEMDYPSFEALAAARCSAVTLQLAKMLAE